MKKRLLAALLLVILLANLLCVPAFAADKPRAQAQTGGAGDTVRLIALDSTAQFRFYDMKDGTLTESGLGSKLDAAFCAAYACGSIFYISTISPEGPTLHRISRTGTEEKTVPLSGLSLWVNAMAYSYADDAMYAIGKARGISENVLAEIDLETGVVTQVCTFADPDAALSTNGFVLAMAIDLAGRIHIMDFSNGTTDLYRLDPAAGTYTRIGTTGIPWNLSVWGMAFSHASGRLYCADTESRTLYEIDTATAEATVCTVFPDSAKIYRLSSVPYEPAAPKISPDVQTHTGPVTVTLTAEAGAAIHYTLDGTAPTKNSPLYTRPFSVTEDATVKAVAVLNHVPGAVSSRTYEILPEIVPGVWAVTVSAGPGGTASADVSFARAGSTVTITAVPDEGYEVFYVYARAPDGASLIFAVLDGNRYAFSMPNAPTSVTVAFTKPPILNPFDDITPDDWFHDDVEYIYRNELMDGTGDTTFDPYVKLTRGMLVTILWRLAGSPDAETAAPFDDVPAAAWYAQAVAWAAENAIADGFGQGRFAPDAPVTREQFAVFLYRYAVCAGYDVSPAAGLGGFEDAGSVSDWAVGAMTWAAGAKLIEGTGAKLEPHAAANRAQAAAILHRFCLSIED